MTSSRLILASVAGVAGIGILGAVQKKQGITRIVAGAYIALLLLSLLDLFGGVWSQLAGALAILALVSSILLSNNLFTSLTAITSPKSEPTTPRPSSNTATSEPGS